MRSFHGREAELRELEEVYGEGGAVLMYGRRGTGKTALIERFCEGRRTLFLRCVKGSARDNLEHFADAVAALTGSDPREYAGYLDFFRDLARVCDERCIVVMDEYQFLAAWDRAVDSYTQHFIDSVIVHSDSMLILCGSSVSAMRERVEDGGNPLFGRFRRRIRLGPLSFEECRPFHPGMSDEDLLRLYLTVGGIPRYHRELRQDTYRGCMEGDILRNDRMPEEAQGLLDSEFTHSVRIAGILSAVSSGADTLKLVSDRLGIDDSTVSNDIRRLCDAGILDRVHPMLGAPSRPRYVVRDDPLAFSHEVLVRRRTLVCTDDAEASYEALDPYLDAFLGRRFVRFCGDLIRRSYPVTEIGTWWRDDEKHGIHEDIDVVAKLNIGGQKVDLFVECRFIRRKVGFHEYNVLDSRVDRFRKTSNDRLMLISVSGFEDELMEFAEDAGVLLVGPEELFGHRGMPRIG